MMTSSGNVVMEMSENYGLFSQHSLNLRRL